MIYILIFLWGTNGKANLAVEFNDLESCKIAANEIQKQLKYSRYGTGEYALLCTPKGKKQ